MRRSLVAIIAMALVLTTATGCRRMVEVQTGVKIDCPYGHIDDSAVQAVEVPAKVASEYRVTTEKRTCDRHKRLESLYAQAQAALSAGDMKTAEAKLREIAAAESGFRKTDDQLTDLDAGKTPTPDSGSGPSTPATTTPNPGESDTSSPIGSLKKFVPDTLPNFAADPPLAEPLAITREYEATSGSARRLVIVAEQARTAKEAASKVAGQMRGYPNAADTITSGSRRIRFGGDGRNYVTAAFTQGTVVVILEMSAKDGVDPIKLKSTILDIASAL